MPNKHITTPPPSSSSTTHSTPPASLCLSSLPPTKSKKLRFLKRRSSAGGCCSPTPTPTYTRSFSSTTSSLSLESTSASSSSFMNNTTASASAKKRRSLLSRMLHRSTNQKDASNNNNNNNSPNKSKAQVSALPPDSEDLKQQKSCSNDNHNDDSNHHAHDDHSSSNDTLITTQVYEEAMSLGERGLREREAGQYESAVATWEEALCVAQEHFLPSFGFSSSTSSLDDWNHFYHKTVGQLISLHVQLERMEEASSWLSQLKDTDYCSSYLEPTPVMVELLMHHSMWSLALGVANELPGTEQPLLLARLHLENALVQLDDAKKDEEKSMSLHHLSECHQLLLSCSHEGSGAYLDLWQELAQAYSMRGEEDLALGCIQSRLQHLTSPTEVALAHYEQALHVYAKVGQYDMALSEAGIALDILQQQQQEEEGTLSDHKDVEHKKEETDEEEKTLLLLKLYQFKADVLCRLGRLTESIEQYNNLLQAYLKSEKHGPADAANICYILGKLSCRSRRFENAIEYFEQELELTRSVVGNHHLAISKILHELARVAEGGLMEYERSLQYYTQALQVENAVCRQLQKQGSTTNNNNKSLLQDAKSQIAETKRCLGKLHFKMGDFDKALKTTLAVEK